MSTVPGLTPTENPAPLTVTEEEAMLANQDDRVVNRLGAARGSLGGMIAGALLWAGLILAGAALIHK